MTKNNTIEYKHSTVSKHSHRQWKFFVPDLIFEEGILGGAVRNRSLLNQTGQSSFIHIRALCPAST